MSSGGTQSASVCLASFLVAVTGWIGACVTSGLAQWRVSQREDGATEAVWVGIWRACVLGPTSTVRLRCYHFQLDAAPPEVIAGQVLMTLGMLIGVAGKVVTTAGLRFIFFGHEGEGSSHACALAGGALFCAASLVTTVPLAWHAYAVNARQDIALPANLTSRALQLGLPLAEAQIHGAAIYLGLCSALLMFAGGAGVASYYRTTRQRLKVHPCFRDGRLARASVATLFSFSQPNSRLPSRPGSPGGSPVHEPPGSAAGQRASQRCDPREGQEGASLQMSRLSGQQRRMLAENSSNSEQRSSVPDPGHAGQPGHISSLRPGDEGRDSSQNAEHCSEQEKVTSSERAPEWVGVG
ncbi:claudin-6-like [Lethenteron reissneri]|uniref:claudin-6-like n=1 Tax=Lethenteron reissneri TaxID=7753 RepID=UPI002AB7ECA8|nr:claudin-6-like [Lethenteron reissneri]